MTQLLHLPKTTVLGSPDILIGGIMQLTVDPYIFTLWSCNSRLFASKTRFNHQGQRVQQTSGWFCFQAPLTILQIYIHIIDLSIYIYIHIYKNSLDTKASLKTPANLVRFSISLPPSWLAWGAIYTEVSEVGSCQVVESPGWWFLQLPGPLKTNS